MIIDQVGEIGDIDQVTEKMETEKITVFKREKRIKDIGLWIFLKAIGNYEDGRERELYILYNKATDYLDYLMIYDDKSITYDNPFVIPPEVRSFFEHYIYTNYDKIIKCKV